MLFEHFVGKTVEVETNRDAFTGKLVEVEQLGTVITLTFRVCENFDKRPLGRTTIVVDPGFRISELL